MKKLLILTLLAGLFASCNPDEFLDVKPTGSKIPVSVEDFDKLLENYLDITGTTSTFSHVNVSYMDPDVWMPENYWQGLNDTRKLQYQWGEQPYFNPGTPDNDWNSRYHNIMIYNTILEDVDDAELGNRTEADRQRVKGEALAQRAYDYFILVNEYAANFSAANLNEPGIPMPLSVDLSAQTGRSTIGEVYAQIEKDLDQAESLLAKADPIREQANFRPGIASVFAAKAMVAMFKGEFDKADDYADRTLNLYNFLYDYNSINNKTAGNAWNGITLTDLQFTTDSKEVIWNRIHRSSYNAPEQFYSEDLLNLFDKTNDKRFTLFSSDHLYSNTASVAPYVVYARFNAQTQAGLTVPELLLVSAEAKVRTGDAAGAIDRLNSLLQMRIMNFTPYTLASVGDDAAVLQLVKNERRKELMATGKNWFDLKRYQAYGDQVPVYTRVIDGQTFTLEPGSTKYIVPVSEQVKSRNPNL